MMLVDVATPRFWILSYTRTHGVLHSYVCNSDKSQFNSWVDDQGYCEQQGTSLQFKLEILEFRFH